MSYPSIVLFGDSITEYSFEKPSGLSTNLNADYARRADIVTKGFAGYTTRWAKPLLKPVLDKVSEIQAIVIFLGTNDASVEGPQHVPVDEYQRNLEEMVAIAKSRTENVVVVGPTLVDELGSHEGCAIRKNMVNWDYNRAALQVATNTKSEFIDLWTLFRRANGDSVDFEAPLPGQADYKGDKGVSHLVHDGIHFTGEAYDIWYEALKRVFKELKIAPSDFEYVYPPWRQLAAEGEAAS